MRLHSRRLKHLLIGLIGVSLVLSVLAAGLFSQVQASAQQDLRLYLTGKLHYVSDQDVAQLVRPYLASGFFDIDLAGLHDALQNQPWIQRVRVRRHWPDGVFVHVKEQVPVARWGDSALVTADGTIVQPPPGEPAAAIKALPLLQGPEARAAEMVALLERLSARLDPLGQQAESLRLDISGDWLLRLRDGLQLRFSHRGERQQLGRYVKTIHPAMVSRLQQVAYLDLRYDGGFAVGWREPEDELEQDDQEGNGDGEKT